MSRASLRAKSAPRRQKKRAFFKRSPFAGRQSAGFSRALAGTDKAGIGFDVAGVVNAINSLLRRVNPPRRGG